MRACYSIASFVPPLPVVTLLFPLLLRPTSPLITNSGSNQWPLNCYKKIADSVLTESALPLESFDDVTLNRCLALCADRERCESASYVAEKRECGIFVVDSVEGDVMQCPGVDHYDISRPCQLLDATEALCPPHLVPVYIERVDLTLDVNSTQSVIVDDMKECREMCDSNNVDGAEVPCKTFVFNNNLCSLFHHAPPPFGRTLTLPTLDATLFLKFCLPPEKLPCDGSPSVNEWSPGKVLLGHAVEVIRHETLEACFTDCAIAESKFGFQCNLAVFYYDDRECILNSESGHTEPDLWVDEGRGIPVHAVQIDCPSSTTLTSKKEIFSLHNLPLVQSHKVKHRHQHHEQKRTHTHNLSIGRHDVSKWGKWTPCFGGQKFRKGYCPKGNSCGNQGVRQRKPCGRGKKLHKYKKSNSSNIRKIIFKGIHKQRLQFLRKREKERKIAIKT